MTDADTALSGLEKEMDSNVQVLTEADNANLVYAGGIRGKTASQRPLRVVHLIHTVAYGGVETIVLDWARALDRRRIEVMVVCFTNPGGTEHGFKQAAARASIPVRTIRWGRSKPVFRSAAELTRLLREFDADIVHTHNVYAEIVGWIAARRLGTKLMTTLYVWSDFGWKRNVQQWVSARLLRRFDLVTSQCQATLNDTVARGVPRAMQCLLLSGIASATAQLDEAERQSIRKRFLCERDDVVLVNVARLYPEKAQDRLLDWFSVIAACRPQARLWILGTGPLEESLRAQVEQLGLGHLVTFVGFVPNPAATLLAADIQVHPSRAEGIPLAVCEGMAAGMPVVATAVGGIPEIIEDRKTGRLIENGNREVFVEAVLELIDDPELRALLGRQARQACETELSLPNAANKLASTYEDLVAQC
jgi:glycosyltransferase involved in cell wall biosynthesis